ncbi:transcriptional regulator, TetR family [Saccharopolyspora kobensis]|uniref:Transcriptional regulator, TetR family n=1 Tax=Saccharopolyspora kobensis TaxID=146035 RepID=A0A1H6D2Z6_9PSEU|nr:TetR/AcrR family transcriptional regulator [Saccharopolyspora kobensis]SEG79759.1 transcriptional regulator, TetR family [Saccharopolyspora kobensis]SFD09374.1 transcriptional regulator, TetR family [Saccharopolyspora kobensis]
MVQGATRRGRPPASEEQRRQQRLDISRHAVRLFREQGVAATSGEQIARAAGVSERTLWRCFRSKEACVEPLLTKTLDAFQDVLRSWPPELELAEHLRAAYTPAPEWSDVEAVLAVIRMTHDEPALRAAYLVLRERAEPTFVDVLAERLGVPGDALEVRMQAAAVSAALRAATDELVDITAEGVDPEVLQEHRERLADALRSITRGPIGSCPQRTSD